MRPKIKRKSWQIIKKVPVYARMVPQAAIDSIIYFIRAGVAGPIKIGITANLRKRVSSIQVHLYEEIIVLKTIKGTREDERQLHLKFSYLCIRNEWFKAHDDILDFIANVTDYLGQKPPRLDDIPYIGPKLSAPSNGTRRGKKLSPDVIRFIRKSNLTEVELSKKFKVSRSMIGQIRRGERWAEVI